MPADRMYAPEMPADRMYNDVGSSDGPVPWGKFGGGGIAMNLIAVLGISDWFGEYAVQQLKELDVKEQKVDFSSNLTGMNVPGDMFGGEVTALADAAGPGAVGEAGESVSSGRCTRTRMLMDAVDAYAARKVKEPGGMKPKVATSLGNIGDGDDVQRPNHYVDVREQDFKRKNRGKDATGAQASAFARVSGGDRVKPQGDGGAAQRINHYVDFRVQDFKQKNRGKDTTGNQRATPRLRMQGESAKRASSSPPQMTIEFASVVEGADCFRSLSRARFEEHNMDHFRNPSEPGETCVHVSGTVKRNARELSLIGGITHTPSIQATTQEFFIPSSLGT